MGAGARSRAAPALGLLLAGIGGLWLATWRLSTASSINDEVAYRSAATALLRGDWTLNNQHPPLAKELIALSRVLGEHLGLGELLADRAPGVACFLLTGLALAALARAACGPWAGVVAAALWWWLPLAPGVLVHHVDRYALLEGPVLLFTALAARAAQQLVPAQRAVLGRWAVLGLWVGAATASKLTGVLAAPLALVPLGLALGARGATAGSRLRAVGGAVLAAVVALAVFGASYAPMGAHAGAALRTAITYQLQHADQGHVQTVAGRNYLFPPVWAPLWFQDQYLGTPALVALWVAALVGVVVAVRRAAGWVPVAGLVVTAGAVAAMSIKLPQYHDVVVLFLDVLAGSALASLGGAARGAARRAAARRGASRQAVPPAWRRPAAAAALVLLVAPLGVRAARGADAVAHLRPGDYRVAARVLRAHGVTGPVVVWGDGTGLAEQDPRLVVTATMPADCHPVALVTDATSIHRIGVDLGAWRRGCGARYLRVPIDRVTVYLRR